MRALALVCVLFVFCAFIDLSLSAKPIHGRASGAPVRKIVQASKQPQAAVRRTKSVVPDLREDSEEEEEEEEEAENKIPTARQMQPRASSKKIHAKRKPTPLPSASGLGAIVKWTQKGFSPDQLTGPSLRERLSSLASSAATKYREVARFAKAQTSSAYERALLAATWPDDAPVTSDQVSQMLRTIRTFREVADTLPQSQDPYRITLHKLWTKMCEKDWRTTVKALFLLHRIVKDSQPEDSVMIMQRLKKMSREVNPKYAPMHYFNLNQLTNLDVRGESYSAFVEAYSIFLFKRATSFTSKFDELRSTGDVALLSRAVQIVQYGLACTLPAKDTRNYITCSAQQQIAAEVRELWKLISAGVLQLVQDPSTDRTNPALTMLLENYLATKPKVQEFLADAHAILQPLRLRVHTDIPSEPSAPIVERLLSELHRTQPPAEAPVENANADDEWQDEDDVEENDEEQTEEDDSLDSEEFDDDSEKQYDNEEDDQLENSADEYDDGDGEAFDGNGADYDQEYDEQDE